MSSAEGNWAITFNDGSLKGGKGPGSFCPSQRGGSLPSLAIGYSLTLLCLRLFSRMGQYLIMNARNDMNDTDNSSAISCSACEACCCRLEVLLLGDDDIPMHWTVEDQWGGWVMHRLDDDWCAALNRNTMKCAIYERRPIICRDYRMGGSECIGEQSRLVARQP